MTIDGGLGDDFLFDRSQFRNRQSKAGCQFLGIAAHGQV
jgi:hypothetical protein